MASLVHRARREEETGEFAYCRVTGDGVAHLEEERP